MFPVTITIHNIAQLTAVMQAIGSTAVALEESTVVKQPKAEAPGKQNDAAMRGPRTSAATTAPSPRTAEAAPSQPAPSDAAPATQTTATEPAAAASSASADKPVTYSDLQKAVLTLHKMDPQAAVPIAKSLGADTFKLLPDTKWAEALAAVNAAIEARKVA